MEHNEEGNNPELPIEPLEAKTKATEESMGELHGLVAEFLIKKLKSGKASATDIAQATKFLKDNNISADPDTSRVLKDAQKAMEDAAKKVDPDILPFPNTL